MWIDHMKIAGFGLIKDPVEIKFKPGNCYIITGQNKDSQYVDSNESGKTTFLHAIVWCLYGRTPSEKTKDKVLHDEADIASVELYLTFERSKIRTASFIVKRTKKRGQAEKFEIQHLEDFTDELISNDLTYVQEEFINHVLKIDLNLFLNSFYIGRENKSIQFLKLSPGEKLKVVEQLVSGDIFSKAQKATNEALRPIQNKELAYQKMIEEYKSQYSMIEQKIERKKTENTNSELVKLYNEIESLETQTLKKKQVAETGKETLEFKKRTFENMVIPNFEHLLQTQFLDLQNRHCLICKQSLPEQIIIQAKKEEKQKELLEEIKRNKQQVQVEYQALLNEYNRLTYEIKHLTDLRNSKQEQYNFLYRNKNKQQEELKELQKEKNEIVLKLKETELKKNQDKMNKELLEFWSEGFSSKGIRSMLLDEIRNLLTIYTKFWGSYIAPYMEITYPIKEKEGFHVDLKLYGKERTIFELSAGAAWRANLITLLAIASTVKELYKVPFTFILLDDLYGDLDETGKEVFSGFLEEVLNQYYSQIFITVPQQVPSQITIRRQNGKSTVTLN